VTELDYRLILDAFADAVVAADGKNRIVYLNAAAEKLLGWSAVELVGKPLVTIIPPRLHPAHHAGFNRYIATHVPKLIGHPVRVPALRRDGSEVDVELTLAGFRLGDEQDLIVGSLRDLRERVELERQISVTRYLRAATASAAKLGSRLDLDHVLQTVVETQVADFDAALARIWLYEADTNTLHLRASAGLSRQTTGSSRAHIDVDTYPYKVGVVARTRKPFIKNGLLGDPDFEHDWVARDKIAAVAAFPLTIGGELRGVLVHFSHQPLPDELVEVLGAFVALVTTCLNDVELFTREQSARADAEAAQQRLGFLAEASTLLASSLDYQTTLKSVARLAVPFSRTAA
jgi:sigma-B regulation protein RsbU (phosphoserine phosphatase)